MTDEGDQLYKRPLKGEEDEEVVVTDEMWSKKHQTK